MENPGSMVRGNLPREHKQKGELIVRKILIATIFAFLASGSAVAQFQSPSSDNVSTAAKSALDDSIVTVTGSIVTRISDGDYIFRDSTGEIQVEIDDDVWQGRKITPENKVRISGEIDRDWANVTIEVKTVEIIE